MKKFYKVLSAVIALITVFTMTAAFSAGASAYQSAGSKAAGKLENSVSQKDRPQTPIDPKTGGGGFTVDVGVGEWDYYSSVTGLKLNSLGLGKVKLTWNEYYDAEGYEIWCSTKENGTYYHKADVEGTCYIDTSSKISYHYKVRAYFTWEWGDRAYNSFSEPVSVSIGTRPNGCHLSELCHYKAEKIIACDERMFKDGTTNETENDSDTPTGGYSVDVPGGEPMEGDPE